MQNLQVQNVPVETAFWEKPLVQGLLSSGRITVVQAQVTPHLLQVCRARNARGRGGPAAARGGQGWGLGGRGLEARCETPPGISSTTRLPWLIVNQGVFQFSVAESRPFSGGVRCPQSPLPCPILYLCHFGGLNPGRAGVCINLWEGGKECFARVRPRALPAAQDVVTFL